MTYDYRTNISKLKTSYVQALNQARGSQGLNTVKGCGVINNQERQSV